MTQDTYLETNNYQKTYLKVDPYGHTARICALQSTSNGKYLVSLSTDKTIRVWDATTRKEIRKILGQIGPGETGSGFAMVLSPDDKYLVTSVFSHPELRDDDGAKHDRTSNVIRIYDFATGDLIKRFFPGHTYLIDSLTFSKDGRFFTSGTGHSGHGNPAKVWYLEDVLALEHHDLFPKPYSETPYNTSTGFYFEEEGDERIVTASFSSRTVQLYSITQNAVLKTFNDPVRECLYYIDVSKEYIAVAGHPSHVHIFDRTLNLVRTIPMEFQPGQVSFSPDGTKLVVGFRIIPDDVERPEACLIFYTEDFKKEGAIEPLSRFTNHLDNTEAVTFLNNSTAVSGGGARQEIRFWDPVTGTEKGPALQGVGSTLYAVGIQGSKIAFGYQQNYIDNQNNFAPLFHVFDLETMSLEDTVDTDKFVRVRPTQGTSRLYDGGSSRAWDIFVETKDFTHRVYRPQWYRHNAFGFTDDGRIVSGGSRGSMNLYTEVGEHVAYCKGHTDHIWDLATQGNRVVSVGRDQILRIWNLDDAEQGSTIFPMLNLFIASDGEWIIWSQSGYYDASQFGDKYIGVHLNQGDDDEAIYYPIDRCLKTLYRPDIIRLILETGREQEAIQNAELAGRPIERSVAPQIKLTSPAVQKTQLDTISIVFDVIRAEEPITRIWILRNNQMVWEREGDLDSSITDGDMFSVSVPLLPGSNELKIYAESELSKSMPVKVLVEVDASTWGPDHPHIKQMPRQELRPNLYFLAAGINDYPTQDLTLSFAVNDAKEIVDSLMEQRDTFYTEIIGNTLLDNEATKAGLLEHINILYEQVQARDQYKKEHKIISQDTVLIYLSGHGVSHEGDFYFLPHGIELDNVSHTGINLIELGKLTTGLPMDVIFIIDACRAGEAIKDKFALLASRELSKRMSSINESAQVIISATTDKDPSYEKDYYAPNNDNKMKICAHGLFTRLFLDAMQESESYTLKQMADFASINVKILTENEKKGQQKPLFTAWNFQDRPIHHPNIKLDQLAEN